MKIAKASQALNYFEYALAAGYLLLIGALIFFEPVIGMANNGDFYRLTQQAGIYFINQNNDATFDPNQVYYCGRIYETSWRHNPQKYYTTALPFLYLGRKLSDLVFSRRYFDIIYLGAVYLFFFTIGLAALMRCFRDFSLAPRLLGCFVLLFMFTDLGYFGWLNTFYIEPASMVYLLGFVCAALILLPRLSQSEEQDAPATKWRVILGWFVPLAIYFGLAALLIGTKPQFVLTALPVIALWWIFAGALPPKKSSMRFYSSLAASLILLLFSGAYYVNRTFVGVNLFNQTFHYHMLKDTPDKVLDDMDLSRDFAVLAGSTWFDKYDEQVEPLRTRFTQSASYANLLRYYRRNPRRLLEVFQEGAAGAFTFRVDGIGYYSKYSGHPPRHMGRSFSHFSELKRWLYPRTLTGMIVFFIALSVILAAFCRMNSGYRRVFSAVALALLVSAAIQLFTALLGEGPLDLVKHTFAFNAMTDIAIVQTMILTAQWLWDKFPCASS
ncbi:hypothetical protein JXA32_03810 [Candidatus Sumerlaeota bacterium]|nr:hypothetical protein [Candidatus Sumerlaeota bacterium]